MTIRLSRFVVATLACGAMGLPALLGQEVGPAGGLPRQRLREPVYRVAETTSPASPAPAAAQPPASLPAASQPVAAQPVAAQPQARLVIPEAAPNEHPLVPVLKVAYDGLRRIDESIHDYTCTMVKRERIDGKLGEYQYIHAKIRHKPFSVYMYFIGPDSVKGREAIYVAGQNEGKLVGHEGGFAGRLVKRVWLDPTSALAMREQRYPITKVGIRNLTAELIRSMEADTKYAECEVTTKDEKIGDRPATMVQVIHPIPRQNFDAHISRVFFDNELGIPIHYDSYLWPRQPGGQPPLEASFTYTNLKVNNGFTARDFDAYNNPEIFQ